jgi:hypothetical protein
MPLIDRLNLAASEFLSSQLRSLNSAKFINISWLAALFIFAMKASHHKISAMVDADHVTNFLFENVGFNAKTLIERANIAAVMI